MGIRIFAFLLGMTLSAGSALAADDLFTIPSSAIVKKPALKLNEMVYFAPVPGDTIAAGALPKPAPGKLYLRRKLDAKTYTWYEGEVSDKAFSSLYAFSLKEKGLSVSELMTLRVFGTRGAKAFQDEQDVYFDKDHLFTSRVPTLYFVQNGVWQTLESMPVSPGVLRVESDPVASILVNGRVVGQTPLRKGPAQPGLWTYVLEAKGYLPLTHLSVVQSKQMTLDKLLLLPLDSGAAAVALPVKSEEIASAKSLPELEALYDRLDSFMRAPLVGDSVRVGAFTKKYPSQKPVPVGYTDSSAGYVLYRDLYGKTRESALRLWLGGNPDTVKRLQSLILDRMRPMESWQLRGRARVQSARFVPRDSSRVQGMLELVFRSSDLRTDVAWKGAWGDSIQRGDSLASQLMDSLSSAQVFLTLENKPVWISKGDSVVRRHFYRYQQIELVQGERSLILPGSFELPEYIATQPEVVAWLVTRVPVKVAGVEDGPKAPLDTAALYQAYMAEFYRGKVTEIPGGKFRYKDKVVEMSPFAIHTTEAPQILFERIRQKNPSKFKDLQKPVHNIDWYTAKAFCEDIGGNLPTEAQWEFAARAGSNKGRIWNVDSVKAMEHAVYAAVSENLGKKNPAYGPQEVGKRRANHFGLYDMAGNVSEWTRDNSSWFSFQVEPKDPTGAYFGHFKMFKGGSWKTDLEDLNVIESDDEDPRYWGPSMGVRCVFPANQKVDAEKVKAFFAKRQVPIPPFVAIANTPPVAAPAVSPAAAKPAVSAPVAQPAVTPAVPAPAPASVPVSAPVVAPAPTPAAAPETTPAAPVVAPAATPAPATPPTAP